MNSMNGPRGPHLVVLDVMMPGIDGIEVCRQINHNRSKVVMLTARDDAEHVVQRAEPVGAVDEQHAPALARDGEAEIETRAGLEDERRPRLSTVTTRS